MSKTIQQIIRQTMPPALQMLTIREITLILGVSRRLVTSWIASGALPAVRLGPGGRLVRVRVADLEAFLAQHRYTLRAEEAALAAADADPHTDPDAEPDVIEANL